MVLWRILAVMTTILFIASIILRRILKKKHTHFIKGYDKDYLVKKKMEAGFENSYYARHGVDSNIIMRYVIRKSSYETSMVANYSKPYKHIVYYVAEFDIKHKLIDVLKITEENTSTMSKIYVLNKKTSEINIIVRECDTILYSDEYVRPKKKSEVYIENSLVSLEIFSLLFTTRHIICEIFLKSSARFYLESEFGLITIAIIIGVSLLYLFISVAAKMHKIRKETLGGKISYDFY